MSLANSPAPSLVLDTQTWLGVVEGRGDLIGRTARIAIERSARNGALLVAAISVWEVAMLVAWGRITLAMSVDEWVAASLRPPGLRLVPLDAEIAIDSVRLPDFADHEDPADRMIIATARREGALVTTDATILAWAARHGHLRTIDARP